MSDFGLLAMLARIETAATTGLLLGAGYVSQQSAAQAPFDAANSDEHHTHLIDSREIEVSEGGFMLALSYNTPYAHRQHEDLNYHHPTGNAKYLEKPMMEEAHVVFEILAETIRKAI